MHGSTSGWMNAVDVGLTFRPLEGSKPPRDSLDFVVLEAFDQPRPGLGRDIKARGTCCTVLVHRLSWNDGLVD